MSDNTDDMNDLVLLATARDEAVSKVKELEAKLSKSEALLAKAVEELEDMQKVPYSCVSHGILMTGINYALAELSSVSCANLKGEK